MKLYCLLISLFVVIICQGQTNEDIINQARRNYENGKFDQTIELTNKLVDDFFFSGKIEVLKLRANAFIAKDSIRLAKNEINRILFLKPAFETNEYLDNQAFISLVDEVRNGLTKNFISSVSKKAETIETAPSYMQIITDKDIFQRGYRDLEEIFHDISGFDISRSRGAMYSNLYQRGFRSSSTDHLIILIDGVEDNELYSNTAYISQQYTISNIKQIEIIYGPASTVYGANAFSGVINIITKDDNDIIHNNRRFGFKAATGFGSFNSKYFDLTSSFRNKGISFTITGRVYHSDEMDLSDFSNWKYKYNSAFYNEAYYLNKLSRPYSQSLENILYANDPLGDFFSVNSNNTLVYPTKKGLLAARQSDSLLYNQNVYNSQLGFSDPTRNWYLSSKLSFRDLKVGFQIWHTSEGSAPSLTDKIYSSSNNGNIWTCMQSFFYAKYEKNVFDALNLSSFVSYKVQSNKPDARETRIYSYGNGDLNLIDLTREESSYWATKYLYQMAKQVRIEIKMIYTSSDRLNILAGLEYRNSNIMGEYLQSIDVPKPENTGNTIYQYSGDNMYNIDDIATYAQVTFIPLQNMTISSGIRVDHNQVREGGYGNIFSPRIALVYKFKNFNIKTIYSEAFKEPTIYTRFAITEDRELNNPKLKPEKVKNIDICLRYNIIPNTFAEIVYYNSFYSNLIELNQVDNEGDITLQYQATGKSHIQGIQLNGETSFHIFSFYANYTYTSPFYTSKNLQNSANEVRIGDIATHQFHAGSQIEFYKGRLNLNLRLNFVGEKPVGDGTTVNMNPLNKIPSYTILNASLTAKDFLKGLSIQVVANNVFNTLYYSPGVHTADDIFYAASIPQYRRNFYVNLVYNF